MISEGIKIIDEYTFSGCTNATKIQLPSTVTTIGYKAFNNCYKLAELNIPEGAIVDDDAFTNCPYAK